MLHASHSDLSALLSAGGCFLLLPSISFRRSHVVRSYAARSAAVVLSRRPLFWPALRLPAACRLRPSGLSGCGLAAQRLMPRPYGPGLDASAGVPLGKRCTLSALDPLPVGLVLVGLGSSRAERALARAVGFRPRRIRSAQRCRVVRRPFHISVARLCAMLGG